MKTAIIVDAGSSSRFAAAQPKQFVDLLGKPVIIHTLERFEACAAIDEIVLVLSEEGRVEFERILEQSEISNLKFEISKLRRIVTGGRTRAESVRNGLDAVDPSTADIVAVHDGARPLVSVDEITRVLDNAAKTGAACVVAEVTDTIKEVDEKYILRTIDRSSLRRALTPQAFRYDVLRSAFDGIDLDEFVTDECYLVEKLGVNVAYVEGNAINIKITRPEDLKLAEMLLELPNGAAGK